MDALILLPPQWTALSPYYAMPILCAEIKAAGYSCLLKDLNIEFYNKILSPEYLSWCKIATQKRLESLEIEFIKKLSEMGAEAYSEENVYQEIEACVNKYEMYWDSVIQNINKAKQTLKNEESFYNPDNLAWAFNIIMKALDIASLPYYPSKIMLMDFKNRNHKLTLESTVEAINNKEENPFYEFYEMVLPSIQEQNPKMIGISINAFSQVVSGLCLAGMLKETMPETHISLGGNFFTRVVDTIVQKPEFFEQFCHSLTYEEGEIPMVELTRAVVEKGSLANVPNLLYLENGKVIKNEKCEPKKLNEIAIPDFSGFDLNSYLSPEIVMPIQASRGCYWGKCTFCDHDYGVRYNLKTPEKLVLELKSLKEKYNIRHFEFIDESISPSYLRKMSEKILEKNLDVRWFIYSRTENGYSQELMDLAFKAGCRMIMWGIESGSPRIMELINKGINLEERFEPLKMANKAGIWNFSFTFFGFPTETSTEALQTINMIIDNKDIINSYGMSLFTLGKHTKLRQEPEKFGIVNIREVEEDLSIQLNYELTQGMTREQVRKAAELCNEISDKVYHAPLWFSIGFREFLYLYLDKYGLDYVKEYSYLDPEKAEKYKKK
ncbi:MAG: hypothetical protein A2Y25_07965 [Candidatus Melainabacteria bacterium GWF2_37_15]|nr:MAG: hypothetical protein A2Y25_07965 [Candidatus Melainabacteria bacterium GWF2_37_15]